MFTQRFLSEIFFVLIIFSIPFTLSSHSDPVMYREVVNSDDRNTEEDHKALVDSLTITAHAFQRAVRNLASNPDSLFAAFVAIKFIETGLSAAIGTTAGSAALPVATLALAGLYLSKSENRKKIFKAWDEFKKKPEREQAEIAASSLMEFGFTLKLYGVVDKAWRYAVNMGRLGWNVGKIPRSSVGIKRVIYRPDGKTLCGVFEPGQGSSWRFSPYIADADQHFRLLGSFTVENSGMSPSTLAMLNKEANVLRQEQIKRVADLVGKIGIKERAFKDSTYIAQRVNSINHPYNLDIDPNVMTHFERLLETVTSDNVVGIRETDCAIRNLLTFSGEMEHTSNIKGAIGEINSGLSQQFINRKILNYNKKVKIIFA